MIRRIEGELVEVHEQSVELGCGHLTYEVHVPACDLQRLAAEVGRTVAFRTLHHLEAVGQGTSYVPRLIGFRTAGDRAFFELLTKVKGLGVRKALRALQLPMADVAAAIADRDVDVLVSLPEIGKRTAEAIITELKDKVGPHLELGLDGGGPRSAGQREDEPRSALARDAAAVLVSLGDSRPDAMRLVERALAADPEIDTPDALIAAAYRLRD